MGSLDFTALGAQSGPSHHSQILIRRDLTIHCANETARQTCKKAWGRVPSPGDSILDFAVLDSIADFRNRMERAFEGQSSSVRRELSYPTGLRLVFDVFYDPIVDTAGTVSLVSFSAVDVTADVLRSDAVRLLTAGLSQTADGVLIADATGDRAIVYANDAAVTITGYARAELVGRNCRFLQGDDRAQAGVAEIRAALQQERPCAVLLRNYRKSGERFYNQFTMSPIRSASGSVTHYIGVQRDISAQRSLEARVSANERMEALGRLASGVAHDMNNFMMAVLCNVDLLRLDDETSRKHAPELAQVDKTIGRARALTTKLLTFARTRLTDPALVDVCQHVAGLRPLLETLLPADIRLTLSGETASLVARVDPSHIEQLVLNLAVNARDAMPRGGVIALTIEPEDATELGGMGFVKIEVQDTGEGMSEEVCSRAFDPFFTTKAIGKGTGLGLATCFGIAKQYGGHIALSSTVGKGTTCTVWLPRCESPPAANEVPASPPATTVALRVPRARILLVEDDDDGRVGIAQTLRKVGYEVLEAVDGAVAVAMIEALPIDALVTDVVLPHLSGIEVTEVCRRVHPNAPLIWMTGYAGPDLALRGIPPDVTLLEKPFSPKALAEILVEMLGSPVREPRPHGA